MDYSQVDRRAEWAHAQSWSWEAAATLGRVQQRYEVSQLARCEPLGRDRHDRLFVLLQGTLWVVGDSGTVGVQGQASVRKLVSALSKGKCAAEKQLHFTLARLLSDGAIREADEAKEEEAEGEEAGGGGRGAEGEGPFEMPLPSPRYDSQPGRTWRRLSNPALATCLLLTAN